MTDRPIVFGASSVLSIIAGEKTQTRRVVRVTQRTPGLAAVLEPPCGLPARPHVAVELCPHGQPGDRLWVREQWTADLDWPDDDGPETRWWHEMPVAFRGPLNTLHTYYRADGTAWYCSPEGVSREATWVPTAIDLEGARWMSSRFMPRWASRLLLEVTSVRVERLQAITEDDAIGEGCGFDGDPIGDDGEEVFDRTPRGNFAQLWDSLNAKRGHGWASNPWVWVVEFKRVPLDPAREAE